MRTTFSTSISIPSSEIQKQQFYSSNTKRSGYFVAFSYFCFDFCIIYIDVLAGGREFPMYTLISTLFN